MSRTTLKTLLVLSALPHVYSTPVLDVRQAEPNIPSPWISTGCFSDTPTSRTLRVASFTDVNNMTIEACLAFCTTPVSYPFAGVEFSRECYCDNAIESTGVLIDASTCNMPCTGAAGEICGGTDAVNIFRNTDVVVPPPAPWVSVGCFSDTPASRTIRTASFTDVTNMTIEACLAFCTSPVAYNFAGVEFSRECYCDNVIESSGTQIDESTCNMPCTGNMGEICGGTGAINIFKNTVVSAPPPPKPKQTVGSFQYAGCYLDGVNGAPRSLPTQINLSNVTAESCTKACQSQNFPVAGCAKYMNLATKAPDSDCSFPCAGDSTEICGAGNRLSVYADTSAPPIASNQCMPANQFLPSEIQFNLEMIPLSGNSPPVLLGAVFDGTFGPSTAIQRGIFELSGRNSTLAKAEFNVSTEAHIFTLSDTALFPDTVIPQLFGTVAQQPTPGSNQIFLPDMDVSPLGTYCSAANPLSPSSYIGPPILLAEINGQTGFKWGNCGPNSLTPSFSPTIDGVQCVEVVLAMTPPTVGA